MNDMFKKHGVEIYITLAYLFLALTAVGIMQHLLRDETPTWRDWHLSVSAGVALAMVLCTLLAGSVRQKSEVANLFDS
jgi:hypothetical protein